MRQMLYRSVDCRCLGYKKTKPHKFEHFYRLLRGSTPDRCPDCKYRYSYDKRKPKINKEKKNEKEKG